MTSTLVYRFLSNICLNIHILMLSLPLAATKFIIIIFSCKPFSKIVKSLLSSLKLYLWLQYLNINLNKFASYKTFPWKKKFVRSKFFQSYDHSIHFIISSFIILTTLPKKVHRHKTVNSCSCASCYFNLCPPEHTDIKLYCDSVPKKVANKQVHEKFQRLRVNDP